MLRRKLHQSSHPPHQLLFSSSSSSSSSVSCSSHRFFFGLVTSTKDKRNNQSIMDQHKQEYDNPTAVRSSGEDGLTTSDRDDPSKFAITLAPPPQKLRAKRWLEQNEIEKWTCLFDAAATINTLLDDDLWEKDATRAAKARLKKQKETRENKNDRSLGAPMTNSDRRMHLREEIRTTLLEMGIQREHLAATITGMGFWIRAVTDTQETIARHHQPWAFCKRHWQTLVAHPYPRKFCEVLTDHRSSARIMCGDVSGEQVRPEDMKSGVVVVDATTESGFAKKITDYSCYTYSSSSDSNNNEEVGVKEGSSSGNSDNNNNNNNSSETIEAAPSSSSSSRQLSFGDLSNLRRLLEITFAHVITALFIENRACRLFVEDRLVYLIMCLIFQHLLERNACLEVNLAQEVELTRQQAELQEVRKILEPRTEMSSWILIGTDPKYRFDDDDENKNTSNSNNDIDENKKKQQKKNEGAIWSLREGSNSNNKTKMMMSPALVKLCQYAVLQRPDVIYYDETAADTIQVMEKTLFPDDEENDNNDLKQEQDDHYSPPTTTRKRKSIVFVPMKDIATTWIEHVKTPYVSFFGPRSWECSLEFRKQILTRDINPNMGIEFTSRGKKSLRAYQKQLDASIKREEARKNLAEEKKKKAEGRLEENVKEDNCEGEGGKSSSVGFTGGRKRKILGLSDNQNRQHTIRQRKKDALLLKKTSNNSTASKNNNNNTNHQSSSNSSSSPVKTKTDENNDDDDEEDFDLDDDEDDQDVKNFKAHGEILAGVGINVDAKMMTRAYPQLRTPCGSGNSFRYRSVARSVLRRGTPIGGVFNSSLLHTLNSTALIFSGGDKKSERHAAPWSVTGKCVIDDLLPELFENEISSGGTTTKTPIGFDKIHSRSLVLLGKDNNNNNNVNSCSSSNSKENEVLKKGTDDDDQNDKDQKKKKKREMVSKRNAKTPSSSLLLLQERTLEYLTGRAVIYECVPVIFGKINF